MNELFKTLGDENRLRIVNLLIKDEFCVCEIEVLLNMTQSNVSRHLNKLKNSGIIVSSKAAQWVRYRVSETFIENNGLLYEYMIKQFKIGQVFTEDMNRLDIYRGNDFNCKWINEDKDKVISVINEENQ